MTNLGDNLHDNVSKLDDQLTLWGAKLKAALAKAAVVAQGAKIDSKKHVEDLNTKLAAAQAKLDEAKAGGVGKWDSFKQGLDASWKELEEAFKKLTP